MASGSRRSTLQTEILSTLSAGPVDTISALAVSLEKSRPAVSRSINKLIESGLVEKQGRALHLTEDGSRETEAAAESLKTATKKLAGSTDRKLRAFTSIHERLVRDQVNLRNALPSVAESAINPSFIPDSITLGTIPSFVDSLSSIGLLGMDPSRMGIAAFAGLEDRAAEAASAVAQIGDLSESVAEMASINALVEEAGVAASLGTVLPMRELADSAIGFATPDFAASDAVSAYVHDFAGPASVVSALASQWQPFDIASLATPIVSAQHAYASILDEIAAIGGVLGLGAIADQSQLLSSTLGAVMDVAGYFMTEVNSTELTIDPDLQMVPTHLAAISTSLAGVFEDGFELLRISDTSEVSTLSDRLYYSSLPVANYAEFSRHLISPHVPLNHKEESVTTVRKDSFDTEKLDRMLDRIDPRLVDKRRGAWRTLNGDNPDRHTQAAASMRGLLSKVLDTLAPASRVPRDKKGLVTRRARVQFVMRRGDHSAVLIDSVCDAVVSGYKVLSERDHGSAGDHDLITHFYMSTTEAAILALLMAGANVESD